MYHASRWGRRRDSWVGIRWRRPFWPSPSSLSFSTTPTQAQDLQWQVENPFRFFKSTRSFALHEAAYNAARGKGEMPRDVVWRTERRLNDPDCRDSSSPDRCAATAGKRYQQSRLGWAAQTLGDTCYDRNSRPRRYTAQCERTYSWGRAREDYVLPEAHTVTDLDSGREARRRDRRLQLDVASAPRRRQGRVQEAGLRQQAHHRPRSLFARCCDVGRFGCGHAARTARQLSERNVVVEDIFIVALGDCFASGESNPDRPVQFSPSREMVYDPTLLQRRGRDGPAARNPAREGVRAVVERSAGQSEGSAAPADGR